MPSRTPAPSLSPMTIMVQALTTPKGNKNGAIK